ncbi:MAG: hypothetical protein WKF86_06615 [Acidimicrobiales bacterium]
MAERIVLARKTGTMTGYRWTGDEPKDLNDLALALDFGATWEGDELVTYDMSSLIWQMEHMGDDFMIDND